MAGQPVHPAEGPQTQLLDEATTYWWYAERFGWTPDQVDDCPAWLVHRLPVIAGVNDELNEEQARRAVR